MKFGILVLCILLMCFISTKLTFAQTVTPSPSAPQGNGEIENTASSSGVLQNFIKGFDWLSNGLVFNTPSILDSTIKLNDGTQLTGLSQYRTIFYDIAVPLFVLIISGVAFSHITNDTAAQLRAFFQRLAFIVALFILTPSILAYSIQFVNLLNERIIAQNMFNLSTFLNDFLGSFMQSSSYRDLFGTAFRLPTWDNVIRLIILIVSIGFLLIGFIYIIFQAVIRFIALLILSVIFPVVLPFALSEKTENITNTYFRTWFTFLIQQPAFVLGFAIVSAILTSILQAHNASIGTLFVYSGALIFLGGINIFIGRIFGEGWSLVSTNAQSMIGSHAMNKTFNEVKRGAITKNATGVRSYAGKFLGQKIGMVPQQIKQRLQKQQEEKSQKSPSGNHSSTFTKEQKQVTNTSRQNEVTTKSNKVNQTNTDYRTQNNNSQAEGREKKKNTQDMPSANTQPSAQKPQSAINTKPINTAKPIVVKRTRDEAKQPIQRGTLRMPPRKK